MKILIAASSLMLCSCVTDNALYFGSYSRVGIDVSSDGAGIGVKNATLNVSAPKENGGAFDLLGQNDTDLSFKDAVIRETVAAGPAAICAAKKEKDPAVESQQVRKARSKPGKIYFGTYTSFSLVDLNWGGSPSPGINFGYKRGVGLRLPVVDDSVGSAFASIEINTTDEDRTVAPAGVLASDQPTDTGAGPEQIPKTQIKGVRSRQIFATGEAAVIKAAQFAGVLNGDATFNGCK